MFSGAKKPWERGHIQAGFFILDIVLAVGVRAVSVNGLLISMPLGGVALIVDFATGALWTRKQPGSIRGSERFDDLDDDSRLGEGEPRARCPQLAALPIAGLGRRGGGPRGRPRGRRAPRPDGLTGAPDRLR